MNIRNTDKDQDKALPIWCSLNQVDFCKQIDVIIDNLESLALSHCQTFFYSQVSWTCFSSSNTP